MGRMLKALTFQRLRSAQERAKSWSASARATCAIKRPSTAHQNDRWRPASTISRRKISGVLTRRCTLFCRGSRRRQRCRRLCSAISRSATPTPALPTFRVSDRKSLLAQARPNGGNIALVSRYCALHTMVCSWRLCHPCKCVFMPWDGDSRDRRQRARKCTTKCHLHALFCRETALYPDPLCQ